jgi:hypothetical protein
VIIEFPSSTDTDDDDLCPDCRHLRDEPHTYAEPSGRQPYEDWEDGLCADCRVDRPILGDAIRELLRDHHDMDGDHVVGLHHALSMIGFVLEDGDADRALYALRYLAAALYPRAQARVCEWEWPQ